MPRIGSAARSLERTLALHHGCAKEFGAQLICEAERFELITRGKFLLCSLDGGWDKISFAGSVPQ
jgi:hypothetical protein